MPDLISAKDGIFDRHPETKRLEKALDSLLRGNDKIAKYAVLSFVTRSASLSDGLPKRHPRHMSIENCKLNLGPNS